MRRPKWLYKVVLLVPILMFLGLSMYEGGVFLLKQYLETAGNEMLLIRWQNLFLDRARSFGAFCGIILFFALFWTLKTPSEKQLSRKQRFVWCGIYLLFSVFMLALCLNGSGSPNEKVRQVNCFSNLRKIYSALRMYAEDHSGFLPPDLETLKPNESLDDNELCLCPTRLAMGKRGRIDYEYYGCGHKITDPPFLLLADRDGNHPFHYRNMMLSDGTNCSRQIPPKNSGK